MIQGKVFLLMGIIGVLIGFLFDVFRAFRISFRSTGKRFDYISAQVTLATLLRMAGSISRDASRI